MRNRSGIILAFPFPARTRHPWTSVTPVLVSPLIALAPGIFEFDVAHSSVTLPSHYDER